MTSYIANHTKKRDRLARLEHDLLRGIEAKLPLERQLSLADEIRVARIRVARVGRSKLTPSLAADMIKEKAIFEKISMLETTCAEQILNEFIVDKNKRSK